MACSAALKSDSYSMDSHSHSCNWMGHAQASTRPLHWILETNVMGLAKLKRKCRLLQLSVCHANNLQYEVRLQLATLKVKKQAT